MANLDKAVYKNGIIEMPKCGIEIDPTKGIGYQYFTSMSKNKDKIFQIDAITGEQETYGAVLQRCVRTAMKMQSLGVTSEDIVSICSLNSLNSCVPYIATFLIGGTVANLDPLLTFNDSLLLMNIIHPRIIFVEENCVEYVENLLEITGKSAKIVVFGHTDQYLSFSEFLLPTPGEEKFVPVEIDPKKTAIVLFSSGSTSFPKGICLNHLTHLRQVSVVLELEPSYDQMLTASRLYWSSTVLFLGVSILGGTSRYIIPTFDTDLIWKVIEERKPKFMYLSAFQMATLCSKKEVFVGKDVSSLDAVYIGGNSVFEHQLLFYRKVFPNAIVKVGCVLTELGYLTYSATHTDEQYRMLNTKTKSIGSAINGISYKVVSLDSREVVGPYDNGELLVKTDNVMDGYYNLDSSEIWDSDGWFKTGEVVYYDEDFYFYHVEQLKSFIRYQNKQVTPKFIENVLTTHPNVKGAFIIGVPHEIDNELPMALVELKNGCESEAIVEELYQLVAENLEDKYKLRGGIKIIKEFPTTPSGKINATLLKRLVASHRI